jgi:hypothetical protein
MDRTKLLFAALLGGSLLLGVLMGGQRPDPPAPSIDHELSGIRDALYNLSRAVDGTVYRPETERWFETTKGALTIWPREGEPVTMTGDRVRATYYYYAGHLLIVQVFPHGSDQASRHEHFVDPLRWTSGPR